MTFPAELVIPDPVLDIARTLEEAGFEAWCVGGAIRDALLGDTGADFDLATSATPEEVQRLFRRTKPIGIRFGTVGVLHRDPRPHEVTTFRHDVETDGRHAVVRFGASLEDDLARRDFTINAIAYHPLRHEWRDPFHGAADLDANVIRAVGDPAQRFREDYLRILRALRFAARLDFVIEPGTWDAARAAAPGLEGLSAERVRDEWFKGLKTTREVERLVELWEGVGAAEVWLPELDEAPPVPGAGAPGAGRDPVLLTVALLGTAAPTALRRLKASNAEIGRAAAAVAAPAEPQSADPVAVRRWLHAAGGAAHDVMAVHALRSAEPDWATTVRAIETRGEATNRGALAINGADLLKIGIPAGPDLGRLLDQLLDRVLERPELNQRDTLLHLAEELR
jgi:tRNA nucleotidyltransferase (CCA-adding enzyme)